MIRILKIIILLELVFFQAHAQKYYIKHYDESDGCPRKLIVGLNQDKDGYLWLSLSGHGLMRFDGYDFELFDTKNKNQHIIEIFKDRKQNLRLGSYKGVLNLTENKIFTDSFTDSSFYARSFYQPNDSMTYMGSEFGKLAVYKDSALILEKKIGSRIGDIKGDNKGNIWFSTVKNEVWRYNQNGFKRFVFDPSSEDEQVWAIQIINNQVVASTLNQIRVFKDNKFVKWEYAEKLYKPYANYMFNDSRGRTWFLHLDAISIWDRGKLTVLKETNFSGMGLVTVFEDASGNFWFGTTKGLLKLQNENSILNPLNLKGELFLKNIYQDSQGTIWTGSLWDGLVSYNGQEIIRNNTGILQNKTMYCFTEDGKGNIWIGTGKGIIYGNHHKGFKKIKGINSIVYSLTVDQNNNIWAGGSHQVFKINPDLKIKTYKAEELYKTSFNRQMVLQLFTDSQNRIWLLSNLGIILFKKDQYYKLEIPSVDLKQEYWGFTEDNFGNFWLATEFNGLLKIDEYFVKAEYIRHSTAKHFVSLQKESNGNIIAGTEKGILRLHLNSEGQIKDSVLINKEKGLIDDNCAYKFLLADQNGSIWYQSGMGMFLFKEAGEISSAEKLMINIKKFTTNNQITKEPETHIKLPFKSNDVSFDFSAIYLKNPDDVYYSFILEGYNKRWSNTSKVRHVDYTNLAPGDYTFKIKAHIGKYPEITGYQEYSFSILMPFWQKWWFICLMVAFTISISLISLYWWTSLVKRKQTEREEAKRKLTELELKFLRGQMNPHFMFNSINSIQNLIIKEDTDNALNYLNDFGHLIRKVLNYSGKNTVTIQEEIDFIKDYLSLEKLRFKDKISIQIEVDDEIDTGFDRMPPMFLQPFVENAIKHGLLPRKSKGILLIKIENEKNYLKCVVQDNGVGRTKSKLAHNLTEKYKSRGIDICQERIDLLKRKFQEEKDFSLHIEDLYEGDQPSGTRVSVYLPLI